MTKNIFTILIILLCLLLTPNLYSKDNINNELDFKKTTKQIIKKEKQPNINKPVNISHHFQELNGKNIHQIKDQFANANYSIFWKNTDNNKRVKSFDEANKMTAVFYIKRRGFHFCMGENKAYIFVDLLFDKNDIINNVTASYEADNHYC